MKTFSPSPTHTHIHTPNSPPNSPPNLSPNLPSNLPPNLSQNVKYLTAKGYPCFFPTVHLYTIPFLRKYIHQIET
ncbi:hypothetical protein POVWA2_011530 [Plasmodium ovale wallikeri]|uniref:Uncharacterized protein n=1 Tax=Plasmodium ovale wallikeri TaxID=864142 RepID=A0A1A8YMK6_PLAOA|nr:hypothetical protein POVWA2_011530 [Plasmodium ovale wallikeri]